MRALLSATFLLLIAYPVLAQPALLPSIGVATLPADSDPICTLPVQTPPIQTVGRPEGEAAADFTLYDLSGQPFHLEEALLQGKPVLMVGASYTCPVFRGKVPVINEVAATYGDQLTTVVVYTVEAHPYLDPSPYFGAVNTGEANMQEGILYQQPTTYAGRKAIVEDMLSGLDLAVPVYLDGPCNTWWNYYGPQPNNAYLIATDGSIAAHHDWFDRVPQDIFCDIDSLLGLPADCGQAFGGQFSLEMITNDTVTGAAGTTLTATARMTNASNADCLVRIVKLQVNLPEGWSTSLCADVCYQSDVDTALVELPRNSTMDFHYYFYTAPGAGIGYSRIGFRNESDFSNSTVRHFWGIAQEPTGMADRARVSGWSLHPNPATDWILLSGPAPFDAVELRDATGRLLFTALPGPIDVSALRTGVYVVRPMRNGMPQSAGIRIVKQ